jgi:putative membrane protein
MPFVDILTAQLLALAFAGYIIVYTFLRAYLRYRKERARVLDDLSYAAFPLGSIGLYIFVTGIWGQIVWPLPGPYNILFYDMYPLLGLLLIAFAFAVTFESGKPQARYLHFIGFFALLLGLATIYYGASGYAIQLTREPFIMFLMYVTLGLTGVLAYPATVIVESIVANPNKSISPAEYTVFVLFWIFIIIGSILATLIAVLSIPAHLVNPP